VKTFALSERFSIASSRLHVLRNEIKRLKKAWEKRASPAEKAEVPKDPIMIEPADMVEPELIELAPNLDLAAIALIR
jgi:hypothetical protein